MASHRAVAIDPVGSPVDIKNEKAGHAVTGIGT